MSALRLQLQKFHILFDRFRHIAAGKAQVRHFQACVGMVRLAFDGPFVGYDCFVQLAALFVKPAEVVINIGVQGVAVARLAVGGNGVAVATCLEVERAEAFVGNHRVRLFSQDRLKSLGRPLVTKGRKLVAAGNTARLLAKPAAADSCHRAATHIPPVVCRRAVIDRPVRVQRGRCGDWR